MVFGGYLCNPLDIDCWELLVWMKQASSDSNMDRGQGPTNGDRESQMNDMVKTGSENGKIGSTERTEICDRLPSVNASEPSQ